VLRSTSHFGNTVLCNCIRSIWHGLCDRLIGMAAARRVRRRSGDADRPIRARIYDLEANGRSWGGASMSPPMSQFRALGTAARPEVNADCARADATSLWGARQFFTPTGESIMINRRMFWRSQRRGPSSAPPRPPKTGRQKTGNHRRGISGPRRSGVTERFGHCVAIVEGARNQGHLAGGERTRRRAEGSAPDNIHSAMTVPPSFARPG